MHTMRRRVQITPIIALFSLVLASLLLQILGMTLGASLVSGGMLGAGLAAAAWGMSTSSVPAALRIRWLLWPHAAVVITITWLAALRLIPRTLSGLPGVDAAVDILLLGTVTFFAELWMRGRRLGRLPLSIALPAALVACKALLRLLSPHHALDIGALLCALAGMGLAFLVADIFCDCAARGSTELGAQGLGLGGRAR